MTREEAKELLPIIQAYAEGKTIEFLTGGTWFAMNDQIPKFDCEPSKYRIKPEPKYRPFKTQEECWNEMLKHQPFGWVVNKKSETMYNIYEVGHTYICVDNTSSSFLKAFAEYKFIDGTPFGVKEE